MRDSLYELIADEIHRNVSLGRDKWKSLIGPQASLQRNCNKEGFNVVCEGSESSKYSRARMGIIANDQNDCLTCDSRIGYGTGGFFPGKTRFLHPSIVLNVFIKLA